MTISSREKALALTRIGLPVFPVRLGKDNTKTPLTPNGHLDATLDPGLVDDWFIENPAAQVGVYTGAAGIVVLDLDTKNGKNGFDSLDAAWLEVPETFGYDTPSGGRHLVYRAPEDVRLAPSANYRGMVGVDIRGGSSWVLWFGDVPENADFTPAPEWMCDPVKVRSHDAFEGDVSDWYESLVQGKPNAIVQKAIDRVSDDMSHSEMIAAQHHAIRLGAEGHPGVPELLARLESAWLSRPAENHTTPEDQWQWKFVEGLTSGVEKAGAIIGILDEAPEWSLDLIPDSIPDNQVVGQPGDRTAFSKLLNGLIKEVSDNATIFSILWNAPVTKDISREWGADFVYKRIVDAREVPEQERENPTIPEASPEGEIVTVSDKFLTSEEEEKVKSIHTFIDDYLTGSHGKGFTNETYAVPAAWTVLSMAFGFQAIIPKGVPLSMNLWFLVLGYSGTGKSSEDEYMTSVLNLLMRDDNVFYNLGANSSPEALHEALLERDRLASIIHHDEASDFFDNIKRKDWMASLKDQFSKWYSGRVDPMQKVRLKELKGKAAETSFNIHMLATPDRLTGLLDTEMFQTGFLARFNWVWGAPPESTEHKYKATLTELDESRTHPSVFPLVLTLFGAKAVHDDNIMVGATDAALERLTEAHKAFDRAAAAKEGYDATEPAVTRLGRETIWKVAALNALHRGDSEIQLEDALVAIHYATDWFRTLLRVASTTSESEFSRDVAQIEAYVRASGGTVTKTRLLHQFRSQISRSPRELDDKIDFLVNSGRLNRHITDQAVKFSLNGG